MPAIAQMNDIVVHRISGCEHRIVMKVYEKGIDGKSVWKFRLREIGAEPPCHFWIVEKGIGTSDSDSAFFIKTAESVAAAASPPRGLLLIQKAKK